MFLEKTVMHKDTSASLQIHLVDPDESLRVRCSMPGPRWQGTVQGPLVEQGFPKQPPLVPCR